MGVARLECAGCECERTELDATGQIARLSTLVTREVAVTSAARCELRLLVLNRTSSSDGGRKFKLTRLFVTGAVPDAVAGSAAEGALLLHGTRLRNCRGPRCAARGAKPKASGGGGGGVPFAADERIDGAVLAKRNEALELLRAVRRDRPRAAREAGLGLLLPPSPTSGLAVRALPSGSSA